MHQRHVGMSRTVGTRKGKGPSWQSHLFPNESHDSAQMNSERVNFRTTGIGCLVTAPHKRLNGHDIEGFCVEKNLLACMYVEELHRVQGFHTHIVFWSAAPVNWQLKELMAVFGCHVNIKRLRKTNDVYTAMAYLNKEVVANLWCSENIKPRHIHDRVLEVIWQYVNNAVGTKHGEMLYHYNIVRQAWIPNMVEGASQDPVCSEDPDKYFK